MSRDEIVREIVETPRDAYVALPDLQVIVRPGWRQIVTPSVKAGGFNEVSVAQLRDEEADVVIDATIAQYRALGCKFVWRVGPDSAPADLAARLARRGLAHGVACGMARATEMEAPAALRVDEVDADGVERYTETMASGWEIADAAPLLAANRIAVAEPRLRGARAATMHLFLAWCDGEPAATAASVVFERSVYLLGGVTRDGFRGRGLYRALVAARLAHARARGIGLATCHARAQTSAPILERLGFETLVHYDNFSG
jgi:GNAT superfamily N-acetyltransferase